MLNIMSKPWLLPLAATLLVLPHSQTWGDDFQVTSLADSGAGSLRQAMIDANALPGPHLIQFDPGLTGTITLASSLPILLESTVIAGPGSAQLAISGDGAHQAFVIEETVTASISHLTITNGQSSLGGGIINLGELSLDEVVITGNNAEFGGGGISNEGLLTITSSIISLNSATQSGIGGGIENFGGSVLIIDSMVNGNAAAFGAGIDNSGQLQVLRSTFANNQGGLGGAIGNTGQARIINSSLSGNGADSGGGIDNFDAQLELVHVTITGNAAAEGGGIWTNTSFTAKNSLIVSSLNGDDCAHDPASPPIAAGNNLDSDGSCTGFQTVSEQALNLQPLANNGGPTLTHALSAGSVALDAASDCTGIDGITPVIEDQRGVARPQGQACDIGAFELEPTGEEDIIFADAFELL